MEGFSPPTPPSSQRWPEEEAILSWNLYRKVRITSIIYIYFHEKKKKEKKIRRNEILNLVTELLIEFSLKWFNCDTVSYLCWERIANIHDSIEEEVLRSIWSKTFTNDLEAIVTNGACEIGSYIVIYVNIVNDVENSKYRN